MDIDFGNIYKQLKIEDENSLHLQINTVRKEKVCM